MTRQIDKAVSELNRTFGEQFSTNDSIRNQHCHSLTWVPAQIPDGVLFAKSKDDIVKAVRICARHRCPIIPYGAGSSLEGHVNAAHGGISIDTNEMKGIIALDCDDFTVTVEPGITRLTLNESLRDSGLFFPIDPGADATIGGMTATRASGTNAVRYGTMKDAVVSIEAVLPNGDLIRTASQARKSSAGYDLTRLLIGSEGTLAIFTEITLRLFGRPECIGGGRVSFDSLEAACRCVSNTIQYGIPIARVELLDPLQIKACNAYSGLTMAETPTLFFEFTGFASDVHNQLQTFRELVDESGGFDLELTSDHSELNQLWRARYDAYYAARALRPEFVPYATDACVPISKLAQCVEATRQDMVDNQLFGPIVGHVGDGNFHVLLLVNPNDDEEKQRAEAAINRLAERAISMGGTCTGEHGIGQGKKKYLVKELGQEAVDMMSSIKKAIDPNNIFNPGKII